MIKRFNAEDLSPMKEHPMGAWVDFEDFIETKESLENELQRQTDARECAFEEIKKLNKIIDNANATIKLQQNVVGRISDMLKKSSERCSFYEQLFSHFTRAVNSLGAFDGTDNIKPSLP